MSDAIRTPTPYTATAPIGRKSTMAILALIAAFIFPVLGVILGTIALVQTSKSGQSGRGLAIAAVIVGTVIALAYLFVFYLGTLLYNGGRY